MSDSDDRREPWLERVREEYRATPPLGPEARERLGKTWEADSVPGSSRWRLGPASRRWAIAAALLIMVGGLAWMTRWQARERSATRIRTATAQSESTSVVRFVLSAPGASQVSLVGDFNDWDVAAAPMKHFDSDKWIVVLPVRHGRHVYAFLVDKARWVSDPGAPLAPEDGFGVPNSVIVVSGPGST
jgi:predicted carbohydrate-binding protein with CBM48